MRFIYTSICLLCLLSGGIYAQQMPPYNQYFINGFVINPALAGKDGTTKFELTARDYWMGIPNSPKTFTASANGRILRRNLFFRKGKPHTRSGRVGMGGLIYNDRNGVVNRLGLQYTYAYHIDLRDSELSLGLSAALSQTHIDAAQLEFKDPEPLLREGFSNISYVPDASLGIFYKKSHYYAGLTISNLFQRSINVGEFDYNYVMYRHYFLLGGTSFDVGENSYIAPSFLFKFASNNVYQGDITLRYSYKDDAWLAVSYRSPQAVICMVGVRAKKLFIGYSYEYNFSNIRHYSWGTQEVNLIYRIGDTARRYRWLIRY